ncbi:50S ribosomal protein L21, chloroplastic [Pistacia vera]|uniref:50S ribosomal protein L21, chloroplastic n=1 Tax=Pistacia vera TaxID=55513 RepID=UPI001263C50B|nr:50S ribosomal protein L21, chloroplastic [Pistacia vera]
MAASSSSTATLALCSSFSSHCKISKISPSSPPLLSFSKPKLPSSLLFSTSRPPAFSFTPKYSASEAPAVLDSEPESPPKPAPVLEAAPEEEKPKREEIFAVVMIGSRQYIVFPGRYIYTQRLKGANVNDKIVLSKVLLVGTKTTTYIGKPVVTNAAVHAVVEEQGLNPKVIVFKYKKKKNYRRNIGHRQPNTRIRITGITGYEDYPAVTLDSLQS